jgi:hypothetical protein
MTNWQKIFIGLMAVGIWLLALYVHHRCPDIDTTLLAATAYGTLIGLGVTHISNPKQAAKDDPADPAAGAPGVQS